MCTDKEKKIPRERQRNRQVYGQETERQITQKVNKSKDKQKK